MDHSISKAIDNLASQVNIVLEKQLETIDKIQGIQLTCLERKHVLDQVESALDDHLKGHGKKKWLTTTKDGEKDNGKKLNSIGPNIL